MNKSVFFYFFYYFFGGNKMENLEISIRRLKDNVTYIVVKELKKGAYSKYKGKKVKQLVEEYGYPVKVLSSSKKEGKNAKV